MENITIELTYDEVKTILRALIELKKCDEVQKQRKIYSREVKNSIDMEIETCMELLGLDGKVYKAWNKSWKKAWKETQKEKK